MTAKYAVTICRAMARIRRAVAVCVLCAAMAPGGWSATTNFYVRGDGSGSDSANGASWATAFATIQKAVDSAVLTPDLSVTNLVHVQGSAVGQTYAVAEKNFGYAGEQALILLLHGGWEQVDSDPRQTGMSAVHGDGSAAGLRFYGGQHQMKRFITVDRFAYTNVAHGIWSDTDVGRDSADVRFAVRNTTVYALGHGIVVDYPKTHSAAGYGGLAVLQAENVDVRAGLGGAGHGIYVRGSWQGSYVVASGQDPQTGEPAVSGVTSANGNGILLAGVASETYTATISNTVAYGSSGHGIEATSGANAHPVRLTLKRCTLADNAGDGFRLSHGAASSWLEAHDSIFADNGGDGIHLVPAIPCQESYNNFHRNGIVVDGSPQAPAASAVEGDPLFWTAQTGPNRYMLRWTASPSYRSGSDGGNRGAHQNSAAAKGTVILFQ